LPLSDDPWIQKHSLISPEKLHALGYLTFAWNSCESWSVNVFSTVLDVPEALARCIAHDLGDITLWTKIVDVAHAKKLDEDTVGILQHASKLYERNRVNRNQFVHAHAAMTGGGEDMKLIRVKGPKLEFQLISDSLEDIRRVAEDIGHLRRYLHDVWFYIQSGRKGGKFPLPGKPSLPALVWSPPPQTPPKRQRQRKSSRA
jgi:hypothetical protein